uniref:Uncharacterized protein n=1 Tax=Anguilla anguilla TaxID=7936 RepID=A0A0E9UVV7_ANGAN
MLWLNCWMRLMEDICNILRCMQMVIKTPL